MSVTTYTGSNISTTWMEPCWCCGRGIVVTPCADTDDEVVGPELDAYCEGCDSYWPAHSIRYMFGPNGEVTGIETCADQFDAETWYERCLAHGKERGTRR